MKIRTMDFDLGKIDRDQMNDYGAQKGITTQEVERHQ